MTTKAECDAMDLRLKLWGAWCRAGCRDPALWESDGRDGAGMTRDQVEDAWAMQCMVMRLPLEMRMVCQVHYVSRPDESATGHGEGRVQEANRRIRAAGVHRRLSGSEYFAVRDRAINNLINSSHLTKSVRRVSSASNGPRNRAPEVFVKGLAA